jgi:hypothetical protein
MMAADDAINATAARLGIAVTGNPISETYLSWDQKIEKIYEYLVLVVDPSAPNRPYVRPLSGALHIPKDQYEPRNPKMYFYPLDGDMGYNVAPYFMDFITAHGGMEISGMPITREYSIADSISRQCFENLCLEHHLRAPESLRVRPGVQGMIYKDIYYRPAQPTPMPRLSSASLKTWEKYPLITSDQEQTIYAAVYDNNIPISGIVLQMSLTMPDGNNVIYDMPATDTMGQSALPLVGIKATNGTLVPYQVCLLSPSAEKFCDTQSFVIWGNP